MTVTKPPATELSYIRAVNEALAWSLDHDADIVVFGEDVALPNGPFGATKGLHARFGERVFDTPISESAMIGTALGLAVEDLAMAKLCAMVEKPEEEFQQALRYVLKKNAELYRRLA